MANGQTVENQASDNQAAENRWDAIQSGSSEPSSSVYVLSPMCTCPNRVDGQNMTQIHRELTCEHYSEIRKLLERNLLADELVVFNSLEIDLVVNDTNYYVNGEPQFKFSADNGTVFTNIEADAVLRPFRTVYQSTIHELWHNIDFVAGDRFKREWQMSTEYQELMRTWRNNPKYQELMRREREITNRYADIDINTISYLYGNNLLGLTIHDELRERITIAGETKPRREFFVDELNKLHSLHVSIINKYKDDISAKNEREINAEYPRYNDRMSGFHYLSDIIVGENCAYNYDNSPRARYIPRREYGNYFGFRNPRRKAFFATEYVAAICCMKVANPDFFYMMTNLKNELNLRRSYQIYTDIISFVRRRLEE
jgi:hypothetical protein